MPASPRHHVHDPDKPSRHLEVKIRLTVEEHAKLRRFAELTDRTITAAVRQAILRELVQWEHSDAVTMAAIRFAHEVRQLLLLDEAAE